MRKVTAFLASIVLLAAVTAPAFAASVVNFSIPVSGDVPNFCGYENVQLGGDLHVTFNETFDSAGGEHFDIHVNSQGISGVGESSGAKYQANGAINGTLNANAGGTVNGTLPINFQLVGQGSVPNMPVHALLHFTVNPDGSLTSLTLDPPSSCF